MDRILASSSPARLSAFRPGNSRNAVSVAAGRFAYARPLAVGLLEIFGSPPTSDPTTILSLVPPREHSHLPQPQHRGVLLSRPASAAGVPSSETHVRRADRVVGLDTSLSRTRAERSVPVRVLVGAFRLCCSGLSTDMARWPSGQGKRPTQHRPQPAIVAKPRNCWHHRRATRTIEAISPAHDSVAKWHMFAGPAGRLALRPFQSSDIPRV
jgi:hypothetical protein